MNFTKVAIYSVAAAVMTCAPVLAKPQPPKTPITVTGHAFYCADEVTFFEGGGFSRFLNNIWSGGFNEPGYVPLQDEVGVRFDVTGPAKNYKLQIKSKGSPSFIVYYGYSTPNDLTLTEANQTFVNGPGGVIQATMSGVPAGNLSHIWVRCGGNDGLPFTGYIGAVSVNGVNSTPIGGIQEDCGL